MASGCALSARRLESRLERSFDPNEGEYPELSDPLFSPWARFTGVIRAERFQHILGFWIFLRGSHRPERIPVMFVHGHMAGPRPMEALINGLDQERFEPWISYYATGIELERSAALLRRSLSEMATRYDEPEVAVVAYSFGGLVVRQALRPADDGVTMPRVSALIGLSVPWAGSEHRRFDRDRSSTPRSWEDIADGSEFLAHLFDDPLPSETKLHLIYSVARNDRRSIEGADDRVLSVRSMTRPEAMDEASSVMVLDEVRHLDVTDHEATVVRVREILEETFVPQVEERPARELSCDRG